MSDTNNSGDKTLSVPGKTLSLKRPVEQGMVRQSFSHGRSKAVVVEKVKRRTVGPGERPVAAAPAPAPAPPPPPVVAKVPEAPARPTPPRSASGMVLRTLTDEERAARGRALLDARSREEEDRRRAELDGRLRQERDERERQEREAGEARRKSEIGRAHV